MTVTQGTSPNFTAEGTIRTAVTGSTTTIVVDVTAGTFASTANTSIDGAASGAVKFVAATNLKAVSLELTRHASVQYKLVTGANSENSATYDFGGAVGRYEFPFHCKGDATGVILRDCNQFSDFAGCSRDNSLKNVQVGSSAFNTTTDSVLLMFKKDESSSTTLLRRVAQPTKMSINMTGENPTTARNQTSYTLERPFNGTQTIDTSRDVRDMDDLVNTMNASKADMVGVKAFSATSTNLDVEFKTHTVTQSTTGASTTTTITVASTANILAGYRVTGHANIQKNTVVASVTNGTTLSLSKAPTASIPNSTSLTFAQEDYTLLPFTLTRRAQKSKQTVDLNFPANDAAGLNPFRGVVFKRRNLTGAPQTTLPQMPYDATMDKLLKRINGPATLTFAAARNFSGANALTAGMSVTQAGGVTGTIAANYSSATTASIVVTVTNGTFVSTKETIIDGATSGVKLVPDADLSTVTHADVPFLVTNSGADLVLEWDVAGAESEITGMIEGSISGMVDSVSVHHQGVLDHTNKRSPNTSLACVNHTVTNNAAANLKLRTKGTQNRVTAVELIESPEAGAEATVSGTTMAVNNGVAHNLAANDWVTVENAINGTNNGTFQVAATGLTATAFTLTIGGSAVAETTRIRWAATRGSAAHVYGRCHRYYAGRRVFGYHTGREPQPRGGAGDFGCQSWCTSKKNQSLTGLTSANGSGLAITCKGRMGRVKSLTRNGSGDLTIAGANIEMNRNKHKNGVRPEGGSGTGCVVNTTVRWGSVGALQVTVAGTQTTSTKINPSRLILMGRVAKRRRRARWVRS